MTDCITGKHCSDVLSSIFLIKIFFQKMQKQKCMLIEDCLGVEYIHICANEVKHFLNDPHSNILFDLFVCFDSLCPSQYCYSHVGTGISGLNQY